MKRYRGIILIIITFVLTYFFWSFEQPTKTVTIYRQYSQLIASFAMLAFAWINYISSRHRWVDSIFNGLDKSYIYHKYLSIISILFIWVHNFTLKMGGPSGGKGGKIRPSGTGMTPEGLRQAKEFSKGVGSSILGLHLSGKDFGSWSLYIFTGFVIFFIIAAKLEYQRWKILHKLMLVPYIFGVVHYYMDSDYKVFALTSYSIWMNIINATGIISALYMLLLYEKAAFKYHYKVNSIREVAKDTMEVTATSTGKEMNYTPGQYAFMKVLGKNKNFPSHPFTMSQTQRPGEIQFAIKALGDHTADLKNKLLIGDLIAVSGPYGKFDYRTGAKRQVWFAGGIGVTPFRSFLQSEIPSDYNIDFFYSYRSDEEGPYVEELKAMKPGANVKIHFIETSKGGRLGLEKLEEHVSKAEQVEVYMCGPKVMKKELANSMKQAGFKVIAFHHEYFQFK